MRTMRKFTLVLVITVCGFTTAQGNAEDDPAKTLAAGGIDSPKWRLSVNPFQEYEPVSMLSIHRSVGTSTDLGIGISMLLHDRTWEDEALSLNLFGSDRESEDTTDRMDVDVHLALEIRRWRPVASRVSWYHGVRLGYGFTYSDAEDRNHTRYISADARTRSEVESWDHSISAAAVLGVDLELIRNLSFAIGLAPLRTSYSWAKTESASREDTAQGGEPRVRMSQSTGDQYRVALETEVAGFVSLSF